MNRKMGGLKGVTYCTLGSDSRIKCEETLDKVGSESKSTEVGGKNAEYETLQKEAMRTI